MCFMFLYLYIYQASKNILNSYQSSPAFYKIIDKIWNWWFSFWSITQKLLDVALWNFDTTSGTIYRVYMPILRKISWIFFFYWRKCNSDEDWWFWKITSPRASEDWWGLGGQAVFLSLGYLWFNFCRQFSTFGNLLKFK